MTSLRNINLNLLPVLHALVHHQNVTRAGEALNMSQSAVSDALANLRHVFQDELLVKGGRNMVLTDLARSLIPQIDEAVGGIQLLLGTPDFAPESINKRFVIATADSVVMTIGPALASALTSQAPAACLQFIKIDRSAMQQVRAGQVDLLVAPQELAQAYAGMRQALLYDEEFVCIMRNGHPLGKKSLTRKAYWEAKHVSYQPERTVELTLETRLMRKEGMQQIDAIRVSDFTLLPYFVEASDSIAMLPRRVAERMQMNSNIQIAKLPFRSESVPMSIFWNEIKHNDPTHRWFRSVISGLSFD